MATKCNLVPWTGSWSRKEDINENTAESQEFSKRHSRHGHTVVCTWLQF